MLGLLSWPAKLRLGVAFTVRQRVMMEIVGGPLFGQSPVARLGGK